jgi:hypothetical protein
MKRFGSSSLPSVTGRTRSDLDLHQRPQSTPTSISKIKHETEVQEQIVLTVLTETSSSVESINGSSERQDLDSSTSFIEQRPGTTWTNLKATPFRMSSATMLRSSEARRKPSNTWNNQLSEATVHLPSEVTLTKQSSYVGETEPSSQMFLGIAPDRASTFLNSVEQTWRTSSVTTLRASEPPRKLSSIWNDQLSEETAYLTTQVTGAVQSGHVGETEISSHTFLGTAPDRASTHLTHEERPWRTSSVTALRASEPAQKPSSRNPSSLEPSTRNPPSSWNDQPSDATIHPTARLTVTRQSSHVNTIELSSRTVLAVAPEHSSTNTHSGGQPWPTSTATVLRTSDPPRKPSTSWNYQFSDAAVYPTTQVTVTSQSDHVDNTELSTQPSRSSTYANSGGQPWPTRPGSTTASWLSSLYQPPDGALLDGHTSSFPVSTSWG